MSKRLRFSISLISVMLVLFTFKTLGMSPTSAKSSVTRSVVSTQEYLSPLTSTLINNINLPRPYWWGGTTGCDTNYPYVGGSVQLVNNGTPTAFRGTPMCGPMPENYSTNIDYPYNLPLGDPNAVQVNDFECTEAAMRYMYLAYGQHPYVAMGGQVVDNYFTNVGPNGTGSGSLLSKVKNNMPGSNTHNLPSPGDVMSLTNAKDGHVVIVMSVKVTNGTGSITIVDENGIPGPSQTNGTGTATFPVNNWYIDGSSDGGTVEAWLHPNTLVASQNQGTLINSLSAVSADAADDVWAVGSYQNTSGLRSTLIEHWNGSNWVYTPSPDSWTGDHYLTGVKAFSPHNVWAVGYYYDTSGNGQTIIEHSTNGGKTWIATTQGPGFLYAIDGASASDIWAVGTTPNEIGLTLHFTNNTWTSISNNTSPGTVLYAVSARTPTDVWAVGNGPYSITLTMHWDSSQQWTIQPSPNLGGSGNYLFGITDIAANNAWAVGRSDGNPNTIGFALHWNGSTWSTPASFNIGTGSALTAITAFSANNIWAVGGYSTSQAAGLAFIEHTSDGGKTWKQLATANIQSYNSFGGITIYKKNGNVWAVGSQQGQTLTEFFN